MNSNGMHSSREINFKTVDTEPVTCAPRYPVKPVTLSEHANRFNSAAYEAKQTIRRLQAFQKLAEGARDLVKFGALAENASIVVGITSFLSDQQV